MSNTYYTKARELHDKERYEEAFKLYEQGAMEGHKESQFYLGLLYTNGTGVEQDQAKAIYWYEKAAEQGEPSAQWNLAFIYKHGEGVEKDYNKAVYWYQKAAEEGKVEAWFMLCSLYKEGGYGIEKNYAKAIAYLERYYIKTEEETSSAAYIANMYSKGGCGIESDYAKAIEWYQKAEESDPGEYSFLIGYTYYHGGCGIEKNYAKAIEWFQKANIPDFGFIGLLYYEGGYGIDKDYQKAIEYLQKDEEINPGENLGFIGALYERGGYGIEKDNAKAFEFYERGARIGDISAKFGLASSFENGYGTERDYKKAKEIYEQIIKDPYADKEYVGTAAYRLAKLYEERRQGIYEDLFKATEYYHLAKTAGYECQAEIDAIEARLNIGEAQTNRMGVFSKEVIDKHLALDELFPEIDRKLKEEFGDTWEKLQLQSRQCLITGFLSYVALFSTGEQTYKDMDFSSAIVPMMKACEIEFGRIFFDKFLAYLKKNNIPPTEFNPSQNKFVIANVDKKSPMEQYDEDESYLYFKQKKGKGEKAVYYVDETQSNAYTLGGFRYYANIDRRQVSFDKEALFRQNIERGGKTAYNGRQRHPQYEITVNPYMLAFMKEICTEEAFPGVDREKQIKEYLYKFSYRTMDMASKLRNPAAHGDIMPYWKAIYCGNLIIMVEQLLKKFIDNIKPEYLN